MGPPPAPRPAGGRRGCGRRAGPVWNRPAPAARSRRAGPRAARARRERSPRPRRCASGRPTAGPLWPAPMTTVVPRSTGPLPRTWSVDLDLDRDRAREAVVHRGALLRLRDDGGDLVRGGVGVDVVVDLDALEAV